LKRFFGSIEPGPRRATLLQLLGRYARTRVKQILEDHCKSHPGKPSQWARLALERIELREKKQ